jgi:two-component system response regulator AtoC
MTHMPQTRVLVVDDEPAMRLALKAHLHRDGWEVSTAGTLAQAVELIRQSKYAFVISDVRLPDGDGLQVMDGVKKKSACTPVILLTAYGNVPEAVRAVKNGACDYLVKPVTYNQLRDSIHRLLATKPVDVETMHYPEIVGASPSLLKTLHRARQAARSGADVLIEAESGTGKELLARFIHDLSDRSEHPFIAVNCSAVPEQLLESELFGHVRGAFTGATSSRPGKFELANHGTILLDEIGDMPLNLQPKLLRALQEREFERVGDSKTTRVDIRVIATTNVNLQSMVGAGRFRSDLYYRLNVIPISLPPLRQRREDIPALALHFAKRFAEQAGIPEPILTTEFVDGLQRHDWPGNVRELSNLMQRVIVLSEDGQIDDRFMGYEYMGNRQLSQSRLEPKLQIEAGVSIREAERKLLETTLELTDGNRTRAAEMLGVSLRTIRNKIREYGLPPRKYA